VGTTDWNPKLKTPQMRKLQYRNKKQKVNSSPLKVNSTTRDVNNKEKEISTIEFQKTIIKEDPR
jgi:hypothetical protein